MWLLTRLVVCSFLQILLLASSARATLNFNHAKCFEISADSACTCENRWDQWLIECPAVEITISPGEKIEQYVRIECKHLDEIKINSLPTMNIGKFHKVAIMHCQLSDEPIALWLDQLGIKNVKQLLIERNIIGDIYTRQLTGLSGLEELIMHSNNLTQLPSDLFVDLSNVTTLILRENFVELPAHIFDPLKKLTNLDLNSNNLEQLPESIFRNQHQLKRLDLSYNRLRNLNKRSVEGLTSLRKFDLSFNGIDRIAPDIFSLLPSLREIYLGGNELRELPEGIFRNQYKLRKLELSYNRLHNLNKSAFEGVTSLQNLDWSFNGIERIEPEIFSLLPSLREIYLGGNELRELPSQLFANNKNLTVLDISTNRNTLEFLPSTVFADLLHLQKVYISCSNLFSKEHFQLFNMQHGRSLIYTRCGIRNIPGDLFTSLGNWTYVSLADNNLRLLPDSIFSDQHTLEVLNLNHNKLQSIQHGLFSNTSSLRLLALAYNQLTELSEGSFLSLGSLEWLDLDNNELHLLPDGLFRKTTNLVKLKLSFNQLTEISAEIFSPLVNLEVLYLDNNKLHLLPDGLFRKTTNLVKLQLSYNQLTEISAEIFSPLVQLEVLFVDNNHLITINPNAFSKTQNIRYINMDNNHIKPEDLSDYQVFYLPEKLQTLKLRNNSIQHIYWNWRTALLELTELDLSFNNITKLDYTDLMFHSNGLLVNISHNQVRTINFEGENLWTETPYANIDLNYNPLDCDCKLLPFLLHLRGVYYSTTNFIIDNLLCDKPDGIRMRDLKPEELLCSIKHPHCPLGCNCWERTYDATLIVNCSNTNLTEVPTLPAVQTIELRNIELHVENNKLLKLPTKFLPGYTAVKKIYAAGNDISQIDVNDLPTELTYLDLSRNKLKRLNATVTELFNGSHSRIKISLADNPWNCDCESQQLMQSVQSMFLDFDSIYCATPKNYTMRDYLRDVDICQDFP